MLTLRRQGRSFQTIGYERGRRGVEAFQRALQLRPPAEPEEMARRARAIARLRASVAASRPEHPEGGEGPDEAA